MTIKEFADMLNGRERGKEITLPEIKQAKELGYVVVFGASDDLCEFQGAIDDEAGCYCGGTIYLNNEGIVEEEDACEECKLYLQYLKQCKTIEVVWCGSEYTWEYKTDIPHETFSIYEDWQPYCQGIVFDVKELG